jgi:hypothetical protein
MESIVNTQYKLTEMPYGLECTWWCTRDGKEDVAMSMVVDPSANVELLIAAQVEKIDNQPVVEVSQSQQGMFVSVADIETIKDAAVEEYKDKLLAESIKGGGLSIEQLMEFVELIDEKPANKDLGMVEEII